MLYDERGLGGEGAGVPWREVVVVEDDPDLLRLVEIIIKDSTGLKIRSFTSCEGALRAFDAGLRPAVIVFDVLMPGVDGNELLRRRNELFPDVPAIAVTASPQAIRVPGASLVLTKPFRPADLAKAIEAAVLRPSEFVSKSPHAEE